jgi:hypothetical protein
MKLYKTIYSIKLSKTAREQTKEKKKHPQPTNHHYHKPPRPPTPSINHHYDHPTTPHPPTITTSNQQPPPHLPTITTSNQQQPTTNNQRYQQRKCIVFTISDLTLDLVILPEVNYKHQTAPVECLL